MFWEDDDPGLLDAGQPETRVKSEPVPEDQECRLPIIDPAFDAPYGLRQIEQINFQIEDPYGGFDDYVSDEYNPATEAREPARRQVKRVRSSHGGYGHRNGSNTSEERGPTRKQVKRKGSFYKRHYGHGAENVFPIAKDPRNSSLLNQRNNGFSLPVTLTLPKVLLTYAQWKPLREFLEQWPDNWPIRNVDEEELPNFTELSYDNIQQDRLRIRGSTQSGSSQDRVGHQQKWEQYSLGHPEARGCKNCVCLGNECELIKGSKYPCRSCYHLGEDCELILEPPEKGPCLHCGKKKMKCSFLENRQQLGGCDQCSRMGFRCISVPRHKHTRYNSRIDHHGRAGRHKKEKVSEKAPIRKFGNDFRGSGSNNFRESGGNDFSEMSCTECRQNDLPCSFAHTPNFEDCEACQESGCECIVDIPQTPPEKRAISMSRREPKESNDKSAHEVNCSGDFRRMYYGSVVTAEGPTGEMLASQIHNLKYEAEQQRIVKSVVGPYPEPGIYNCEEHGLECKWCLLDYGSRAVPNSRSIIRGLSSVGLSGGMVDIDFTREFWSDPGNDNENSPMCISCTTERMLILGCPAHIMYPLNWRTIQMEGPVGFGRPEEYTWCSICLEPAKFVCDTENFSDKLGCGFALCCSCFNKFEDAQCIMVRFFDGLLTDCDMTLRGDASHLWDFGPVSRALMSEN